MATGTSRTGTALAAVTLLMLTVLDLATPGETVSLAPLFVLAPMIAAVALSTSRTVCFALLAVLAAIASGWWNGSADTGQHLVRLAEGWPWSARPRSSSRRSGSIARSRWAC